MGENRTRRGAAAFAHFGVLTIMNLSSLHALVADENRSAAELVRSILGNAGVRRITIAPIDAFAQFQEHPIGLLIVDQSLGQDEQAIPLVRRVRNDPASPNVYVPILMLTGQPDVRRVIAARDAGVSEFLVKPFSAASLLKRVEALIQQPRAFVRSSSYFGPDRRRRADPSYRGPERRGGK